MNGVNMEEFTKCDKREVKADELLSWEPEPANQLKPFQEVLVRDSEAECWTIDLFGRYVSEDKEYPFVCLSHCWAQCIPYEGNEQLYMTKESPKPIEQSNE